MFPVLLSLGGFHIYSFGLMVAAGVLLALFLMTREGRRAGFPTSEQAADFVFATVLSGFLGARLLYVVENWQEYGASPLSLLAIWEGGLIFYGGMIGAFLGDLVFLKVRKMPVLRSFDFFIPYVALCHAFGRLGCFLNGCCYGDVCDLPWAVRFPEESFSRHPAQLYEAALNLGLFFVLQRFKKRAMTPGIIMALYFAGYALIRFSIEFVRTSNPALSGWTYNQWISIAVLAAALVTSAVLLRKKT